MSELKKNLSCSFCGKQQTQVKKLIAGPDVYICDDCVRLCADILAEDKTIANLDVAKVPSCRQIKEFLDQYVIGQHHAKIALSVAINNHYKRVSHPVIDGVELEKSNIALLGPSGSGKTLLAQSIARLLDVPFVIADATSLTESGYVGDDVETIITRLVQAANGDVERAERGIIYLDEVDKKAKRAEGVNISRDVSGEGVQQALLKIIEGSDVRVSMQGNRKHPNSEMINVNTRNILFIVGGAFVGLTDVIAARVNQNQSNIGFTSAAPKLNNDKDNTKFLELVEPVDLIKYGLIPELVGRLQVVTYLDELTEEQLVQVLTIPKNALIRQFIKLFKLEQIELEFEQEALIQVAKQAISKKTGARGLRSVIEKKLIPVQFELADLRESGVEKIRISKDVVNGNADPILIRNINAVHGMAV